MTADHLLPKLDQVRAKHGPWTAHNIEISPGIFTMAAEGHRSNEALFQCAVQTAEDVLRRPSCQMRVLDLGCLEGGFSIEFGRRGATCVGVEIRRASLEKARFSATALGLDKVNFVRKDIRDLDRASMGEFDVILCWGILYHLDSPAFFTVLERLRQMSSGLLIIDTHISLAPRARVIYRGKSYFGSYYREHTPSATDEEKEGNLWASIDNCMSFWPTRASLFNFLAEIGFTSILENANPLVAEHGVDRINLIAVPGTPTRAFPQGLGGNLPPPQWQEENPKFVLDPANLGLAVIH